MGEKGVRERLLGEINNNQWVGFHTARFSRAVSSTRYLSSLRSLPLRVILERRDAECSPPKSGRSVSVLWVVRP